MATSNFVDHGSQGKHWTDAVSARGAGVQPSCHLKHNDFRTFGGARDFESATHDDNVMAAPAS